MKRKKLAHFGFALYLILLIWLVLFKLEPMFWKLPQTGRSLNLIPFGAPMLSNGSINLSEIIYNALFFAPLGLYLSMLNITKNAWQAMLLGMLVSIAFESVQYLFKIGASDVTDVIMNTLGTAVGALIGLRIKSKAGTICSIMLLAELCVLAGYTVLLIAQ